MKDKSIDEKLNRLDDMIAMILSILAERFDLDIDFILNNMRKYGRENAATKDKITE